ncbi:type VI secretion system tube protein TssD [Fibrella sp. WM1]|uniref:type VI secretion system tube protein TssD n=1 Tax=Fibrella musci TaxID=3242485 RepID=UPI003520AA2C
MASFTAFLEVGGKKYPLYRYELYVRQEVDELGRPASPVLGGTITCTLTIPADQDSFLYQWMVRGRVRLAYHAAGWQSAPVTGLV